jgi:hypothetical protein
MDSEDYIELQFYDGVLRIDRKLLVKLLRLYEIAVGKTLCLEDVSCATFIEIIKLLKGRTDYKASYNMIKDLMDYGWERFDNIPEDMGYELIMMYGNLLARMGSLEQGEPINKLGSKGIDLLNSRAQSVWDHFMKIYEPAIWKQMVKIYDTDHLREILNSQRLDLREVSRLSEKPSKLQTALDIDHHNFLETLKTKKPAEIFLTVAKRLQNIAKDDIVKHRVQYILKWIIG